MADEKLSSEEIQRLFEQDKAERLQKCRNGIEAVLRKHKCQLIAMPGISIDGRVIAEVQIQILS